MQKLLSFNYLYLVFIFASAILSLNSFRLNWPKPFKIFSVFLWFTLLIEIFAISWTMGLCKTAYWNYSWENLWIYNAFTIISHLFFLAYFYHTLTSKLIKRIILITIVPFLVFAYIDYFIIETPHRVTAHTFVLSNLIIISLALANLLPNEKDKIIAKFNTTTQYWIVIGTLVYYTATLPLFIVLNYLNEQAGIKPYYIYINDVLNIIMYTLYSIAFLCKPHSWKS